MTENEDLYEVLQVHPAAQPEVIQAAYQRLAQLHHPDVNPSQEAAEQIARLNRAYEVLCDPDQRAAYDRSRSTQATRPSSGASPSETSEPRPRRRTRHPTPDHFTVGSRKADVTRVQGPPDNTSSHEHYPDEELWAYNEPNDKSGYQSVVTFSRGGQVVGWMNRGRLKVQMVPGDNVTTSDFFSIGSHKDDVVRLQRTPYNVRVPSHYVPTREEREWDREMASISREFGLRDLAKEEREIDDNISGLDDDDHRETWLYYNGTVEFSTITGRVTAWQDDDGAFNVRPRVRSARGLGATDSDLFTLESSKERVAALQGEPDSRSTPGIYGEEDWRYSGGTVKFDAEQAQVIYWENRDGSLKTRGIRPDVRQYDFEQGRRARIDAWRQRKKREEKRTVAKVGVGCLAVVLALVLLSVVCGAVLN